MNKTNTTDVNVGDFAFMDWKFEGNEYFLFLSVVANIVNVSAFVFIYRNRERFDNKGFWEQLLFLCANDVLNSIALFLFSLFQQQSLRKYLFAVNIAGALFAFTQMASHGSILGITIQRFISVQKVDKIHKTWTKRNTILYGIGNLIITLSLIIIYFVVKKMLPDTLSSLVFVVEISLCVIVVDVLCFLIVFWLNKHLKKVCILNDAVNTEIGSSHDHPELSNGGSNSISAIKSLDSIPHVRHAVKGPDDKTTKANQPATPTSEPGLIPPSYNRHTHMNRIGSGVVSHVSDHGGRTRPASKWNTIKTAIVSKPHLDNGVHVHASCSYIRTHFCHLKDDTRRATTYFANRTAREGLKRVYRYKRDAGLTVATIVLFLNIVTFVPVSFAVISRFDPNPANLPKYRAVVVTMALNSLINPFVYVFRLESLRSSAYKTIHFMYERLKCR